MTASGCALQARAIAEKFVLKKPPPGGSYRTDAWSVTTNPVGHPSRQGLLVHDPDYKELIREGGEGIRRMDVVRALARNDLFKSSAISSRSRQLVGIALLLCRGVVAVALLSSPTRRVLP